MQNQAAVEALYSATFVEDYLDCVENLPNDLQRHLSRLREFDLIQYSVSVRKFVGYYECFMAYVSLIGVPERSRHFGQCVRKGNDGFRPKKCPCQNTAGPYCGSRHRR